MEFFTTSHAIFSHSLQLCVWKEGLALYLIGEVFTPKIEGDSQIFEKIVEKEVEVSKLTFWNFFL